MTWNTSSFKYGSSNPLTNYIFYYHTVKNRNNNFLFVLIFLCVSVSLDLETNQVHKNLVIDFKIILSKDVSS